MRCLNPGTNTCLGRLNFYIGYSHVLVLSVELSYLNPGLPFRNCRVYQVP
jgi:hypothetical protein